MACRPFSIDFVDKSYNNYTLGSVSFLRSSYFTVVISISVLYNGILIYASIVLKEKIQMYIKIRNVRDITLIVYVIIETKWKICLK